MRRQLLLLVLVALCASIHCKELSEKAEKQIVTNEKAEKEEIIDANRDMAEGEDDEDFDEEEDISDDELAKALPYHPVYGVKDPLLQELTARSRRPSCSNRKCTRWYRGYWSDECRLENYPAVAYCGKTQQWCCARCEEKNWCTSNGGSCMLKDRCPEGRRKVKNGCFGKWWCCFN